MATPMDAAKRPSEGRALTHEELQQQLQRELERELEEQFAAPAPPRPPTLAAKQEIRLGSERPAPRADAPPPRSVAEPAGPAATAAAAPQAASSAPERARVDTNDPKVPQEAVIAQLKADLREALVRKGAEEAVLNRLAQREAQVLDLKKRLVAATTPRREPGAPGGYNPLVTDPLLCLTLRKQARDIQRLKEEFDRERHQNALVPNELPSHTALRLVSKWQALQKENALLAAAVDGGGAAANHWALLTLLQREADRATAALNAAIAQANRTHDELKEAQGYQQKIEVAVQKLLLQRSAP